MICGVERIAFTQVHLRFCFLFYKVISLKHELLGMIKISMGWGTVGD